MATRIVTVSHASGAGGSTIGRSVADRLGFRYVDEEIIELAAQRHGIDPAVIADTERRKNLLQRILDDLAAAPMMDPTGAGAVFAPEALAAERPDNLRALIVEAIRETAQRGEVVIVSHAAGIPLAGRPDLLRILVTASIDTRVRRLAEGMRGNTAEAEKLVKASDAGRADYFERFYKIERELPTHYDLVLNTDALTPEEAIDVIVAAAKRKH